jgi:diguanylate cyclase (GGDEF)-like protein
MAVTLQHGSAQTVAGKHFSCSMTAVLLARVQAYGGPEAVAEVLQKAGSTRSPDYLIDIVNWISYDEAAALWRAGALVTHHPQFARAVGEDAARRLNGSPIAALLRSLGSPEAVYRQIAVTSSKYSVATRLEALDVGPGFAEIVAIPEDGFPRDAGHCAWTCGLLTQPTVLFGLPPATVEHEVCAALGAADCRYRVTWDHDPAASEAAESERNHALAEQIAAMKERLHSMFRTASDLIGADEIAEVLARITERAAVEIRAPRYLLAIRATPQSEMLKHHKGFEEDEVNTYAERILDSHPAALPESWLVVPVRSSRRDYGRLLALYDEGRSFFPEERELLEVYARYAASALDSSTALMEAKQRYGQSSALLKLARALAAAGTSGEVASRLAEAAPLVVDCDRVGVYLWEGGRGELVRRAVTQGGVEATEGLAEAWSLAPIPGGPLEELLKDPGREPIFVDAVSGDPILRELNASIGAVASILVPLATPDQFLGLLGVSVMQQPERLNPSPDLLDRLSGVVAQATIALQNGRLVDQITHQALHDGLTGLANRLQFTDRLRTAVRHARDHGQQATLFYLDLDYFKPVNDEFGHDVGDELLIAVGARLLASTRSTDTVARLGGDEFAVLVDARTSSSGADLLSDRLADVFRNPFTIGEHRFSVGASVGRATFPVDADSAESMLRAADAAMFERKRATHLAARRPVRR